MPGSPTARAIASACSHVARERSNCQHSKSPWPRTTRASAARPTAGMTERAPPSAGPPPARRRSGRSRGGSGRDGRTGARPGVGRRNLDDRPLSKLDRSWPGAGTAGELGGPCAQPTPVDGYEVGRVRHEVRQLERPLHVGVRLDEGEHRLGAAGRLHRCDERIGMATGRRPVDGQLRRPSGAGTRPAPRRAGRGAAPARQAGRWRTRPRRATGGGT